MTRRTSLVLVLGFASCTKSAPSSELDWVPIAAPDLGGVVAKVGGVPIFAKQVLAEAKRNGTTVRVALDRLIDECAVAEGARRLGRAVPSARDVDVESALVQRYLDRELEPTLQRTAIPDSLLRTLYDRVRERFVHPRLIDVGVLAIYTGARMMDAPRRERTEGAKQLAAFLAQHPPGNLDDFKAIAKDPRWAKQGVVYREMLQSLDEPLSKVIGIEIQKLRSPGQTTGLLSDETGFFIARYVGEKPSENVNFEKARETIVAEAFEHWRSEQFLSLTGKLLQSHNVVAHFDRIAPDEQRR